MHFFDCGNTLTINYYCDTIERLWLSVCHHRPRLHHEDVIILLNSDRPYTARWTCEWLRCYGLDVMDQPSYLHTVVMLQPVFSICEPL